MCRGDVLRSRKGFTLLEVVISGVVFGLTIIVGLNALHEMVPAARVNRAARGVAALLEWARWNAVEQGCVFRVEVDPEKSRLSIFKEAGGGDNESEDLEVKRLDVPDSYRGVVLGVAERTRRTSGCRFVKSSGVHLLDNTVKFKPSGTPDRCGSVYLIPEKDLRHGSERMFAVSLILATGRIQLWRYDPYAESECSHGGGAWVAQY